MRRWILLDSGVLGLLTSPFGGDDARACSAWLARIRRGAVDALVPPIVYYEVRREMTRLASDDRLESLARGRWIDARRWFDEFTTGLGFAEIDVRTLRIATEIWAEARRAGHPTASDESLDADVILAATARRASRGGREVTIVTTNVGHLSRYVRACRWDEYPIT